MAGMVSPRDRSISASFIFARSLPKLPISLVPASNVAPFAPIIGLFTNSVMMLSQSSSTAAPRGPAVAPVVCLAISCEAAESANKADSSVCQSGAALSIEWSACKNCGPSTKKMLASGSFTPSLEFRKFSSSNSTSSDPEVASAGSLHWSSKTSSRRMKHGSRSASCLSERAVSCTSSQKLSVANATAKEACPVKAMMRSTSDKSCGVSPATMRSI
mmetsp:Transcript_16869/g.48171  ORF Transcript_16869/g.48171 Transcript_16869/m.48171 type:complete len:216 (-) Transcript_16869:46-693(-)